MVSMAMRARLWNVSLCVCMGARSPSHCAADNRGRETTPSPTAAILAGFYSTLCALLESLLAAYTVHVLAEARPDNTSKSANTVCNMAVGSQQLPGRMDAVSTRWCKSMDFKHLFPFHGPPTFLCIWLWLPI